jgi:phosphate:Na+ symporter
MTGRSAAHPAGEAVAPALPAPPDTAPGRARPSAPDPAALARPDRALACTARAVLPIGNEVEAMLRGVLRLSRARDEALAGGIRARARQVDRMRFEIRLHGARPDRAGGKPATLRSGAQPAEPARHLEAAGDAVAGVMVSLARRMEDGRPGVSAPGREAPGDFHDRVPGKPRAALNVRMTLNPDDARALVVQPERLRGREKALQRAHPERLRRGEPRGGGTSTIHRETLHAPKPIDPAFPLGRLSQSSRTAASFRPAVRQAAERRAQAGAAAAGPRRASATASSIRVR